MYTFEGSIIWTPPPQEICGFGAARITVQVEGALLPSSSFWLMQIFTSVLLNKIKQYFNIFLNPMAPKKVNVSIMVFASTELATRSFQSFGCDVFLVGCCAIALVPPACVNFFRFNLICLGINRNKWNFAKSILLCSYCSREHCKVDKNHPKL